MTIGEKIKFLRLEKLKISQVAFANAINVSKQTLYKYENNIVKNIPVDKIKKIATLCNVSPDYLFGYHETSSLNANIFSIPETRTIPLLGTIACGSPILATENIAEYVSIDGTIHADFALLCKGDSMINARIFDGDIVYIKKQPIVNNGEIAAIIIKKTESEAEATLKRFYYENNRIHLCSENPIYPEMSFSKNDMDCIQIIGKAIAFRSFIK